ncbi:MAG: hypothetical protein HY930_01455 [Euryarchaeota archaeon]|nr:hypothetical protein [Euryarchaeota archaeon]
MEYISYFITGGGVVTIATWLARMGHPFLSGIALMFPSVTLVSFYFLGKSAGGEAVSASAKSALRATFFLWLPYMTTIIYLTPRLGVNKALLFALAVFLMLALIYVYIK